MEITKELLKKLRECSTIVVWHDGRFDTPCEVKLTFKDTVRDTIVETNEYIKDVPSRVQDYQKHGDGLTQWTRHYKCSEVLWKYTEDELVTAIAMMKVGDVASFEWIKSNNNEMMNELGIHHDELKLKVSRGDKRLTFMISSRVSQDGMARMCKSMGKLIEEEKQTA